MSNIKHAFKLMIIGLIIAILLAVLEMNLRKPKKPEPEVQNITVEEVLDTCLKSYDEDQNEQKIVEDCVKQVEKTFSYICLFEPDYNAYVCYK